jgi:hypothetical protein
MKLANMYSLAIAIAAWGSWVQATPIHCPSVSLEQHLLFLVRQV